jgi:hypothetical protein
MLKGECSASFPNQPQKLVPASDLATHDVERVVLIFDVAPQWPALTIANMDDRPGVLDSGDDAPLAVVDYFCIHFASTR